MRVIDLRVVYKLANTEQATQIDFGLCAGGLNSLGNRTDSLSDLPLWRKAVTAVAYASA